ncbi:FMN-dependent dehydrogenase [Aspergillus egyptiacus]|nr:FMN-dependent dehydrogenase [Aspergillus egyptiacus]
MADYISETFAAGLHDQKPPITFHPLEWESLAKQRLSANSFGYLWGSAGTRETDDRNRAAFKKWAILPSRLVGSDSLPNLKTTLFGDTYDSPIALAPVGVQNIFHPEGEIAAAAAAEEGGVPYIVSTAASTSLEDVAAVTTADSRPRWFQLYWPSDEHKDITASLLKRAKQAGYKVLVVTLDTYMLGWRPSDLDNGYNPFIRKDSVGVQMGFSDPVFRKHFQAKHGKSVEEDMGTAAGEWAHIMFPGTSHSWRDIKDLQELWDGPIILKGIQTADDARRAVEHGVQGIVVSNHGGRQQDGGIGSLDVLSEIVDAVGDKVEVIFDSGIRCGADVVKALALGAKMVLVGRPYVYGLAIGGRDGVRHVVRSILGDLSLTLHLSGIQDVSKDVLNRSVLRRVE